MSMSDGATRDTLPQVWEPGTTEVEIAADELIRTLQRGLVLPADQLQAVTLDTDWPDSPLEVPFWLREQAGLPPFGPALYLSVSTWFLEPGVAIVVLGYDEQRITWRATRETWGALGMTDELRQLLSDTSLALYPLASWRAAYHG